MPPKGPTLPAEADKGKAEALAKDPVNPADPNTTKPPENSGADETLKRLESEHPVRNTDDGAKVQRGPNRVPMGFVSTSEQAAEMFGRAADLLASGTKKLVDAGMPGTEAGKISLALFAHLFPRY